MIFTMKLSDELLLKSLRADVLSGVADDHWELVCKAVDDAGDIREVRGYARTVIFDAIEKFNPNHDQLGQFATGGAGGLGGGAAAGRSGGRERSGKNVAEAMRKYPDLAPFADKVSKMPFVTEKDLDEMLPDYIAGKSITNAFRESDASPTARAGMSLSDIDAEMQNLSAKNQSIVTNSRRFAEDSKEFRLSNPYRANTTEALIANLKMRQEGTAPKTKQPFLDTTDIEPDMGTGATQKINKPKNRAPRMNDPAGWLGDGSKQRLPDIPGSRRKKK